MRKEEIGRGLQKKLGKKILTAAKAELEQILALQKQAYVSEAEIYDDFNIEPLTQSLEEIEKEFDYQLFLKLEVESSIVGSVRAYEEDGTCHIGKLVIHPAFQNQGYGSSLLHEIESRFSSAERYELFTGDKSRMNLSLYAKHGYGEVRRKFISEKLSLVFLQKLNV